MRLLLLIITALLALPVLGVLGAWGLMDAQAFSLLAHQWETVLPTYTLQSLQLVVGVGLGWCGAQLPDAPVVPGMPSFTLIDGQLNSYLWLTRLFTAYYFAFFLIIMPVLGLKETPLPIPATISEPVLPGVETQAEKG